MVKVYRRGQYQGMHHNVGLPRNTRRSADEMDISWRDKPINRKTDPLGFCTCNGLGG